MDILNFLLDTIEKNANVLAPAFKILSENSFDIKKVFDKLTPEDILRIYKDVSDNAQKNAPYAEKTYGVAPISDIADKEIVYALNKYVNSELY